MLRRGSRTSLARLVVRLFARCREYVTDADLSSQLDIGTMSLVRIQSAFSIFRQLVLEARASGSKLPNGGIDGDSAGDHTNGSTVFALQKEIEDLRNCLEQRDNELKILVGMVKQGKTTAVGADQAPAPGSTTTHTNLRADYIQGAYGSRVTMGLPVNAAGLSVESASPADSKHSPRVLKSPKSVKPARQPPAPQFIHGILPPSDVSVLADPQQSFEYFMQQLQRSEVLAPIEANKQVLKEKMTAAKALGEKANAARNSIQYLRKSIEMVRKEKAVQNVLDGGEADSAGDGKRGGDGDDDEAQLQPSEKVDDEEARLRQAIETEKEIYRSSFTGLRELKAEIEHIQMILEKVVGCYSVLWLLFRAPTCCDSRCDHACRAERSCSCSLTAGTKAPCTAARQRWQRQKRSQIHSRTRYNRPLLQAFRRASR